MLESPAAAGGDTLISSSVQAYKSLSPGFRRRLEGLLAVHSTSDGLATELAKNGDKAVMRRGVVRSVHPVVTVHPVTGDKALCEFVLISFSPSSKKQSVVEKLSNSIYVPPTAIFLSEQTNT